MSQTKLQSFKETCVQTFIGYSVAIFSQLLIFPFFNINVSFENNLLIGVWFTVISVVRQYIVRRFFNKKQVDGIQQVLKETLRLNKALLESNAHKDRYNTLCEKQLMDYRIKNYANNRRI